MDPNNKTEKAVASTSKTILFAPLDCVGHVNSLISIADALKQLGHRTVFLFYDPMDGGLSEKGHEVYDCTEEGLIPSKPSAASEKKWDNVVGAMGKLWRSSLMEIVTHTARIGLGSMMKDIMKHEERFERKLNLIKPDLIVVDHYFIQPAIIKSGKCWTRVYSASPLALHPKSHKLPPATLGLPTNWLETEDPELKKLYLEYDKTENEVRMELYEQFNDYLTKEHKLDPLPCDPISYIYNSPYLNVYMCAEELDYDHVPAPEHWTRCDSILRINSQLPELNDEDSTPEVESIAEDLKGLELASSQEKSSRKTIFLSMGSLASGDVELMKRLVSILSKSPHDFIVSRGPNWQKYELASNMRGERFVPQLEILPKIDLIITHGGNNTITECFYFGVPGFVVCPIFSDQYDNAQRIEEKGLGKRVNPFHCSDEELLSAIELVLADKSIPPRMKRISQRMQLTKNKFKAIRLFKELVETL